MKYELYTGRYTDGPSKDGVCSWTFDGEVLRQGRQYGELTDPSYVLPQGDRLYVVEELPDRATVACFSLDEKARSSVLWHKEVPGVGLCHGAIAGNSLYVSQCYVTPGPILKRIRPSAHGRAFRVLKRTSHITIVVKEKE